jgi:hypothetical protein
MVQRLSIGTRLVLLSATTLLVSGTIANPVSNQPEAVVARYNAAINERDLDQVLAQLVEGASQLNLRQAHTFTSGVENLVTDLALQWRQISPILFASTESYTRTVGAMKSQQDGDLATVWAEITTRTKPVQSDETVMMRFTETYMLFRLDGTWKIAALANNRPTR